MRTALAVVILSLSGSAGLGSALAAGHDRFGIAKIYPTRDGEREWLIDMDDPKDGIFDTRIAIEKQPDEKYQVRMNV